MTADYEIWLKKAWEACPCRHPSRGHWCCTPVGVSGKAGRLPCCKCEGGTRDCTYPLHAALLGMVGDCHEKPCICGHKGDYGEPVTDMLCIAKRRRLRAAIGISDE